VEAPWQLPSLPPLNPALVVEFVLRLVFVVLPFTCRLQCTVTNKISKYIFCGVTVVTSVFHTGLRHDSPNE